MLKMLTAGAAALGLLVAATGGQAAPIRAGAVLEGTISQPVETVQFYERDDDFEYVAPPAYRPTYRVYRAPPAYDYVAPRPVYRAPPAYGHYPPPPVYRAPPAYGYYDRETAKDYVKGYRRAQKEVFKERVRAWNRANGY